MKQICIIGANIIGLYNAIKYIDTGFNINIYEKKNNIIIDTINNYKFSLYNDNHKNYINLLKKFNIKSTKLNDITFNDKVYNIINYVIEKTKLIPYNVRSSYSFLNICKLYLNNNDFDFIFNELNKDNILNNLNACDFISIFSNDFSTKVNYYYISKEQINLLLIKLLDTINNSYNIKIKYNYNIVSINYKNNFFIINNDNDNNYEYVICTLSKNNINKLKLWNNKNLNLFNNNINTINELIIKHFIDNLLYINIDKIENEIIIRNLLLNNLHISYPFNNLLNNKIDIWNNNYNNTNSILIKDKIKYILHPKFYICSLSLCNNSFFINYLIENIDNTKFIKIKKKKK